MKKWIIRQYAKIVTWFKEGINEGTGYLIPLDDLIERAEKRFLNATGHNAPLCGQCFIHRGIRRMMQFRHSNIFMGTPIRDDQGWKCTVCFHTLHHGIPMSREEAEDEMKLRGNSPHLMRPSFRPDERDLEVVKERLRRLGYIE